MIDYNNLPSTDNNVSIFYAAGSTNWQTWVKPKGCKFVYMFVLGGGGGGGGGLSGTNVARTGGGGGGSSGINKGMFMASALPDTLYINVGTGGAGGVPNGNGSVGSFSYVSVLPNTTTMNVVLVSNSTSVPAAGNSNGVGGSTGGVVVLTVQLLNYAGVTLFTAGQNGASGGVNTGGNGTAISINNSVSGGAGGGGSSSTNTNGTGGNITMGGVAGIWTNLAGGAAGGTNNGAHGFSALAPNKNIINRNGFLFTGGAGGGANGLGVGGNGGNGAFGCGGGGGGAGITGGSGGRGGDGLVIIITS
jgi:hypothetical protein